MQQLTLVSRLMPLVRRGEKTSTIRWQEGDIVTGPLRLVNQQDEADTVIVWVTRIDTLRLNEVAAKQGKSTNGRMRCCWRGCASTILRSD